MGQRKTLYKDLEKCLCSAIQRTWILVPAHICWLNNYLHLQFQWIQSPLLGSAGTMFIYYTQTDIAAKHTFI